MLRWRWASRRSALPRRLDTSWRETTLTASTAHQCSLCNCETFRLRHDLICLDMPIVHRRLRRTRLSLLSGRGGGKCASATHFSSSSSICTQGGQLMIRSRSARPDVQTCSVLVTSPRPVVFNRDMALGAAVTQRHRSPSLFFSWQSCSGLGTGACATCPLRRPMQPLCAVPLDSTCKHFKCYQERASRSNDVGT